MNTIHNYIVGQAVAQAIVNQLVKSSAWFEFEPYPDDEYKITVKPENQHLLMVAD